MTTKTKPFNLKSSGLTDTGQVRENNEDAWKVIPESNVYVLADGMGGHTAGEIAAQEAVDCYASFIKANQALFNPGNAKELLAKVIREVNGNVFSLAKADRELRGMGTTICCGVVVDEQLYFAHVGDSRIYRFRDRKIDQLTDDHSLVQELIELGELNKRQAKEFNQRNIITKAIGTEPHVEPAIGSCDIMPGDIFLMCSDGLSDLLSNKEIEKILNLSTDIDQKTELFVQSANRRGGLDNITVILLEVSADEQDDLP